MRDNLGSEGGLSLLTQLFRSLQQLVLGHLKSMVAGVAALTGILQQSGGDERQGMRGLTIGVCQ